MSYWLFADSRSSSAMVAVTSPMSAILILSAGCVAVVFEDKAHFSSRNKRDQVGNSAHELAP